MAAPPKHSLGLHPRTFQRELGPGVALEDGWGKGIGPAAVIRRAVRRTLVVLALALAGLLVGGLLPGGRDAPTVIPSQYPLPAVPTVHDLHPHGPNRLVKER